MVPSLIRRLAGVAVVLATVTGAPARAAGAPKRPPRDARKEAAIVEEVRKAAPAVVDDFVAATAALDAGRDAEAAAGFRKVLAIAPSCDAAVRRLGGALVRLGQEAEGVALLERAVSLRRSPENLFSLALGLSAGDKGKDIPDDVARRALSLLNEGAKRGAESTGDLFLRARLELQLAEHTAFGETSGRLLAAAPELAETHYLAAIRAVLDERWSLAEREIREAGRRGLDPTVVRRFLDGGVASRVRAGRIGAGLLVLVSIWLLGLAALYVGGRALSAKTLASIEQDDPNHALSPAAVRRRAQYRKLVTIAGVYWFVSLPFVALLVVAATAGVFYAFFAIGRIPIKLAAILIIGAFVSLFAIVRSLFVRASDEDPGRAIREEDAPALWRMARDVASRVGTRPVDEVWLTPGTDLAVYERGNSRNRLADTSRRALLLGAGVLDGFDQNAFRAVLAHEYGHFAHRDTAGGEVALRVSNGMHAFALALAKSGFAVWWNLAFQFLRTYDFLFRRISHGATRLQEVLADRVSIQLFGLEAFRTGLSHVVRRSLAFRTIANAEIGAALEQRRPLANLYSLSAPEVGEEAAELDREARQELEATTSEDNTHPSPKDRFRLGERIRSSARYEPGPPAWELFRDPAALAAEMTAVIAARVAAEAAAASVEAG